MTARTARRATSASARRRMRVAAAAAGLAAALALTGCSSDEADSEAKESSAAPTAAESADGDGGSGDSSGAETELQGNWLATTDGKAVGLFVNGDEAAVFVAGGSVCSGKVSDSAGMQMINLKCTDGNDDRASGMVDSVDAESLTITWEGGAGEEKFQKAEGALPSGLPTDLTADLPTASAGS
ncbi:hypothetical protein [Streptomyces tailanensis]|uniref:hypothetical protein n=1 Tax=Streptomyces tailanensis TaxID=2569858 RepID=UPI00122E0EF9|nr:hypothetical protein [Streptomyces tailanensis]